MPTAFQTHVSHIGNLQAILLHSFINNFIDPNVIKTIKDLTSINFTDCNIQLSNDDLGISGLTPPTLRIHGMHYSIMAHAPLYIHTAPA